MGGATAHGHAFHASSVISPLLSFSPRQFSSDLGACGPRVGAHTTRYTRKRCLGQLSYGLSYVARLIFLLYAAPTTDNVTSALLGIRNMIKEEHDPLFRFCGNGYLRFCESGVTSHPPQKTKPGKPRSEIVDPYPPLPMRQVPEPKSHETHKWCFTPPSAS
jgi:hypothetical protein